MVNYRKAALVSSEIAANGSDGARFFIIDSPDIL